jgi:hypothetical protein
MIRYPSREKVASCSGVRPCGVSSDSASGKLEVDGGEGEAEIREGAIIGGWWCWRYRRYGPSMRKTVQITLSLQSVESIV